jgi:hypothetical protein
MKKLILSVLLFPALSFAQKQNEIIVGKNYFGNTIDERAICDWVAFSTKPEVSMAIEKIVKRSGLKQNFYVMECPNTDNCFAATRNGERLIVYDSKFMNRLSDLTKTDWGALSILAHEIGHHLQGHTIKPGGSEHEKELEADEFSGFVMYQMGATLKQAQAAIASLTTEYTTSTHPPRSKRLKSIATGYNNALELYPDLSSKKQPLPPVVATPVEVKKETSFPAPNEVPNTETVKTSGCVFGTCTEGFGTAINSKTGEKFEGTWHMGKRHGKGKEYYKDGKLKYDGEFAQSIYNGKGVFYFKNGDRYTGGFYRGKMHGSQGTFTSRVGDRIIVDYIDGKKEGKARVIYYGGTEGVKFYKNDYEIR